MTKEEILNALKSVKYPPYNKDIVSFGMVKYVKVEGGKADVRLFTGGNPRLAESLARECAAVLAKAFPQGEFNVGLLAEAPEKSNPAPTPKKETLSSVKMKIAVASGKGGVGKSTVAVNLARAFAEMFSKDGAARVGLMDCDIHGPSAAMLFGQKVFPTVTPDENIVPPEIGGVKVISMGMLVDDDQPLLWRGPMVSGAIKQFAEDLLWGELDAMVIDLPPGTGDAVLSAAQIIPLDGALIVTTPNNLAAATAVRGAALFSKTSVPILGVVENMAYFQMPDGSKEFIFGEGFADGAASALGTEVAARIPLDKTLHTDSPSQASREIFASLAKFAAEKIAKK